MEFIDLRSDTVSQMTESMKLAMINAKVGDDVFADDPTTIELEKLAAELTGKEAALFVPTGTFGNELCLMVHCNRGDEVIAAEDCHIISYECGAAAYLAGVQTRTLKTTEGLMDIEDMKKIIRKAADDIHYPSTKLICLENALGNGQVAPLSYMKSVCDLAKERDLAVHLDGARIFNAAAALGVEPKEIAQYCDSLSFCLSKGLCCPMGSLVCGTKDFIKKARAFRKMLGGGMRQTGYMAAAGLVALKEILPQIKDDHKIARWFASELAKLKNFEVTNPKGEINIVYFQINQDGFDCDEFMKFMLSKKIKIVCRNKKTRSFRFVTHYWIREKEAEFVMNSVSEFMRGLSN